LSFHLSSETLKKTNFADLHPGNFLNLEFPLKLNDFLGGHWVTGHIDGMVRVRQVLKGSGRNRFAFSYSTRDWEKYLFPKGSVALNGISLTLVEVHPTWFSVEVIPHTLRTTNLATVRIGQRMNLELDFLGKTLYTLMKSRLDGPK
jgi:riboflavin synthase